MLIVRCANMACVKIKYVQIIENGSVMRRAGQLVTWAIEIFVNISEFF